ncbi:MAG: AMP-dependent synthetase and ligase [Frankiales bacterium]|nr:AMP-dependent synthetase and ligase [Frankiales bacterium]
MTSGLGRLAEQALERLGDHRSLEFEGTWHTAAEQHASARRLAAGLVGLGVRPGERVVVCMTNCPEVLLCYAALWRAGAVPTPVISAVTPVELRHVLTDSGAVLAVASEGSLALVVEAVQGLDVRVVLAAPALLPGADLLLGDLLAGADGALVPRTDADLAALLYTGGTTGRAKGVMLSHGGLRDIALARAQVFSRSGAVDLLLALPLSHVYGLLNAVTRAQMAEPGFVVLQRRFDAAGWLALAAEHRPQAAALVPSMLQLLLRQDLEAADLSSLRYVTTGGAPLAVAVREQMERRVPGVRVCDGYGCTEVTSTATMNPYDAPRSGSVGLPLPGVELKVVDELDEPVPTGSDGEVCVRSAGVMQGYWRDPTATAAAVRDGWMHTGDVGHLDADGYLYVVDRIKDLIIRGGFNVYPRDVEDVLLEHPSVATAAVVGRPDEVLGEEVVAYVSLTGPPVAADDLIAWCRDRLGRHKHPREVHVLPAVPLTSVGKTDRKALRRLAAQD